ncbi:MAG: primosomal protein N' [Candidatus Gastranaerophilales bacterium]|nr:primosomal protein N' [Candidatus Gastranaerophilales bacterium]
MTASGKTEVYFHLIKEVLKQGKNVIFLVPEIALASQLAKRFVSKFGIDDVAIWHSSISDGEKYDVWQKMKENKIRIIIGARSAIFAPLQNLGLIIIDEEHEATYKQTTPNPRYDARLLARKRAKEETALLLLGSATPDINSYYEALNSNRLIVMTKRYKDVKLPTVKIVDMRFEHSKGAYKSIFSNILRGEIEQNLADKKQTILLVNRRGFATTTTCQSCGHIIECPKCSIPLIYHKQTDTLRCHYCNFEMEPVKICPECGEETIKNYGLGTQKVEEYAKNDFPNAKIARLDSDVMSKKNLHIDILNQFMNGDIDILIGTQMIAKGMDNPNVTLVGVMLADQSFNLPDYRASERGFQLLTQVAGRAGRGDFEGRVIFQSYAPDFFALKNAKQQDYKTFYQEEIQNRYELAYPPYSNLIRFIISSKMEFRAEKISMEIAMRLNDLTSSRGISEKLEVLGPSPCVISKINNEYRFQILIKNRLGEKGHFLITSFIKNLKVPTEIKFLIDVDPTEML